VLAWILATPVRDFDWGRPKFTLLLVVLVYNSKVSLKRRWQRIHPSKSPQTRQSGKLCNCVLKGVESGKASLPVASLPTTSKSCQRLPNRQPALPARQASVLVVGLAVYECGSRSARNGFELGISVLFRNPHLGCQTRNQHCHRLHRTSLFQIVPRFQIRHFEIMPGAAKPATSTAGTAVSEGHESEDPKKR